MNLAGRVKTYCLLLVCGLITVAGLSAHAQAGTTNLRMMPIGDSITAGYQSSTADGYRGPLWNTLTGQVATQDFVGTQIDGTMLDPDTEGHYGWRIDQIAGIINASLAEYKPNVVLLLIGINDLGQNYQVSTAPNRLASLIDQIHTQEPDAVILVSQLIVNSTPATESEVVTFNNALPAIVSARANQGEHVALVNMSALTTADLADGLHPNNGGYAKMATAWDGAINTAISNGWVSYPLGGTVSRPSGYIYSGVAGKCLDDYQGGGSNTKADIWDCSGSTSQWNFNNGQFAINGVCLDVVGGGTANNTLVDLWGCSGASNQIWQIQANGTIMNPASGRCLDDPGGNTTNGTQLIIYDCNNQSNQQWLVPTEGPITSGVSPMCLDIPDGVTANNTKAEIYTCNNSFAQQWKIFNHTVQYDGKCLDIVGGGTTNNTLVDLWQCSNQTNQVWVPQNGQLVNPVSGECLDDPGFSTTNDTQVDLWTCSASTNHQWTLPE